MKRITILIVAALISAVAFSQSKNPTNKKEIAGKIKQAQQQLNGLTPEQKRMMEQMGISAKVPSMPMGATDADVKNAASGGGAFGVPSKNAALIAAIPQITLTAATVPAYIKSLNDYVQKGIASDAKLFGQQVYAAFKSNQYNAAAIGNAAIGYWASGQLEIAVYMMGRACSDQPTDEDLLSNFAAMLSMGGAPHRAIPLLEYLNQQYPDNTTILNNLGQAWFYLGQTDKADVNLEKVVKAFAYHPQANYTQCLIQQSKGNTSKAIEKMKKSLQYSYSLDKVNMLSKLGYKIKGSDMRIPFRPDPDPLGLRKFVRPDVPVSYDQELKLSDDWDAFQKQVNEKSMSLAKDLIPYQQAAAQRARQVYDQFQKSGIYGLKTGSSSPENIYRKVAEKNLEEMSKDGGAGYRLKKAKALVDALLKDFQAKDEAQRKALEKQYSITADKETELAKKGENIGFDNCTVQQKYSEWVYTNFNKPLEEAWQNYLHQLYLKITEELYWEQFIMDDATFASEKITAKKEWLAAIGNSRYIATKKYGNCTPQQKKDSRYKLADFDEMHCAFISVLDFGKYKQVVECGKMRVEFDAGPLSGHLDFKSDNKGNDHFEKGTLEAAVIDKSISAKKGPLQIGASVKAGVGVEFTSRGVEDVYVTGEASLSAKSNIVKTFDEHISNANGGDKNEPGMGDAQLSDKGVEIGVSGKMSLISGNTSTNVFVNMPK